jgi:dUTP pyrophosphatase
MKFVRVKKLDPAARLPEYATDGSGCFDLFASTGGMMNPGGSLVIDTGLAMEVPEGWVLKIYSRSGHGFNGDVRLSNCVGVIDSDYRGQVKVKLKSDGGAMLLVTPGDRVAQGMLVEVERVSFVEVDQLTATGRGLGGFGSTGK